MKGHNTETLSFSPKPQCFGMVQGLKGKDFIYSFRATINSILLKIILENICILSL